MSLGGSVVRSFTDLRCAIEDRLRLGGPELEDDLRSFLQAKRNFWTHETWEEAICSENPWSRWTEAEATVRHEDYRVAAWVARFAESANLTGPDAHKIALLFSPDYAAQIVREAACLHFSDAPLNSQVLKFYFLERRSLITCRCLLLDAVATYGVDLPIARIVSMRPLVVRQLSDSPSIRVSPARNATSDAFRTERDRQVCFEQTCLLQFLIVLNGVNPDAASKDELELLASPDQSQIKEPRSGTSTLQSGATKLSPFSIFSRSRSLIPCPVALAKFRVAFSSWVVQSLVLCFFPQTPSEVAILLRERREKGEQAPLSSTLSPDLLSFLTSVEGPEGSLFDIVLYSMDAHHGSPAPSHPVFCSALCLLRYMITGVFQPPPGHGMETERGDGLPRLDFGTSLGFLTEPIKKTARRLLNVLSALTRGRTTEVQLLVLSRANLACKAEDEPSSIPEEDTPSLSLTHQLTKTAGWLFPSCISTTVLLEIVRSASVAHQEEWWLCFRDLDKVAVAYPFEQQSFDAASGPSRSSKLLADLPEESELYDVVALPAREKESRHREVPVALGNWFAPLALIPGPKAAAEAERVIRSRLEAQGLVDSNDVTNLQQFFAVWRLPEGTSMNGWLWMCMRVLHVLKLGRRVEPHADKWLTPFLELVDAIVRVFHVMIFGPVAEPDTELQHFMSAGYKRLQELESCLEQLQSLLGGGDARWSLALVIGDVLANLVEWQETKCYAQQAAIVGSCSSLLKSLLQVSRRTSPHLRASNGIPYSVPDSILSAIRCLFQPGGHNARSPLLHLLWVVEAATKKSSCTFGVLSLFKELAANAEDAPIPASDLLEITNYAYEIFSDLSRQWHHGEEQWELALCCLNTVTLIMKQTRLQKTPMPSSPATLIPKAARTKTPQASVLNNILHHPRTSRALLDIVGRACSTYYDLDRLDKGPSTALTSAVLLKGLEILEQALEECDDLRKKGQPTPGFVSLLCKTESGFPLAGDRFTVPAMLFHITAFGPDDIMRIQASKTFALLCLVETKGSLLRHVGHRANSSGFRLLRDVDPNRPSGAWAGIHFPVAADGPGAADADIEIRQAYLHGLQHPHTADAHMPNLFRSRQDIHLAWLDASRNTCRLLCLLRLMRCMVEHQSQLFIQCFMKHGHLSDPLGQLLRDFVVIRDEEDMGQLPNECRPAVKEAVMDLIVSAFEAPEPCRSIVLARTVPTLTVKITAESPGLGDLLAREDGRGCPWDAMPAVSRTDLQEYATKLQDLFPKGKEVFPKVQFDRVRSWTHCGFTRLGPDVVEAPMSFVLGPLSAQPTMRARADILRETAELAKKSFVASGVTELTISASWFNEARPVFDPEVWPIMAEALAAARVEVGMWISDDLEKARTEWVGGMSWWILIAAHVLRGLSVVSALGVLYPASKATEEFAVVSPQVHETAVMVTGVSNCVNKVFGKWGDVDHTSPTCGVLCMLVPSIERTGGMESLRVDGVLGQAAGLFYGTVAVPMRQYPRVGATPRRKMGAAPAGTPSPRKTIGDITPKLVSPLIRPAFAHTPRSTEQQPATELWSTSISVANTPLPDYQPFASTFVDRDANTSGSERVTLYELLRKAETAVHQILVETGVAEELVPGHPPYAETVALALLRGRLGQSFSFSDNIAPSAWSKAPGAFIDLEAVRAAYPRCGPLIQACQHLNEVVGLAAAASYMLTSTTQLISILLKRHCPIRGKDHRMLPSPALLDTKDWVEGGRQSLVYVLLKKLLLHPPHDGGSHSESQYVSPLVSWLDANIRAEACRLLAGLVAEVSERIDLVRNGKLSASEAPLNAAKEKNIVNRFVVWDVFAVLSAMHAKDDGPSIGSSSRSREGEADLVLSLCLLSNPGGGNSGLTWPHKGEPRGELAAIGDVLFPQLQRYLSIEDLSVASLSDNDCYKAAFVALCTYGVPRGAGLHCTQLVKTLMDHLRKLHRTLYNELIKQRDDMLHSKLFPSTHRKTAEMQNPAETGQAAGEDDGTFGPGVSRQCAIQRAVDRVYLILKGLRAIAASPAGSKVLVEAEVLYFFTSLSLFTPPVADAVVADRTRLFSDGTGDWPDSGAAAQWKPTRPAEDAYAARQGQFGGKKDDAAPVVFPGWHGVWVAVLDVVVGIVEPEPLRGQGVGDEAEGVVSEPVAVQLKRFVEFLAARVAFLLSAAGLRRSATDETLRLLQLMACLCRCHFSLPSWGFISAQSPALPWILPALTASLPSLRLCIAASITPHHTKPSSSTGAKHPASTTFPSSTAALDGSSSFQAAVFSELGALSKSSKNPGGVTPQLSEAMVRKQCLYFDILCQVLSVLRLHVVSFLPVTVPLSSSRPSPQVRGLLKVLDLAADLKGQPLLENVNQACTEALTAPEPCVRQVLKEAGHPFSSLSSSQLRRLKDVLLAECAPLWCPSATATPRELLISNAPLKVVPESFEDVAIFGVEDDVTNPAKELIDLTEAMGERLAGLLSFKPSVGDGNEGRLAGRVSSLVKAAACAIEHAVVLRQVYIACLELASPSEVQSLWASNVLQRLLNERSFGHLVSVPGIVLRKRLAAPLAQLAQSGKQKDVRDAHLALAFHCIGELKRQPEPMPWLLKPTKALHEAAVGAAARGDPQGNRLSTLVNSTIQLLRHLSKEYDGVDIALS
ncbi:hypothetical protein DIPPA_18100 [Diplonema papillatum]|nr:hypothetical protein DIPPA_18100 [Diplonema papillatum]